MEAKQVTEEQEAEIQTAQVTKEQEAEIQTAQELATSATAMVVKDHDTHVNASDALVTLQTKKRGLEDLRDYQLEPIKNAKRNIEEARKRTVNFWAIPIDVVVTAIGGLDQRMVSWRREERRKADVETARLRAAEQKKVDAQKAKLDKVADGLEKKGLNVEAAEVRDRVAYAPMAAPVHVAPRIETVQGANIKIRKVAEVDEKLQLALLGRAIDRYNKNVDKANEGLKDGEVPFSSLVPAAYWTLNKKALDTFGQKTDGQVQIPGVRWVEDESTQPRRRR